MRVLVYLLLLVTSAQVMADAPDEGPCGGKTMWPGFVYAAQHTPAVYLDVYQGKITLNKSQHLGLLTFSALHGALSPGCHTQGPCLNSNLEQLVQLPVTVKMSLDKICKPAASEVFDTSETDGIKQTIAGQEVCLGVTADGSSMIADICDNLGRANRLYWIDWQ